MPYDIERIRAAFPSLHRVDAGRARIFLDNPGGTQVARRVMDRTTAYYMDMNANGGGHFITSRDSDALLDQAHDAMADLLGATSGDEIIFGQNMTSLTFSLSRAIGRTLKPGDEIVVTRMDHDANVSPWLMLAEDLGLTVRWIDFDPATYRYSQESIDAALNPNTAVVAVNYASNALGTVNDVASITKQAHAVGALVYVDSVQFTPHFATDVQELGCDFLACSAYKFYGPHQGIVWGRRDLLESLTAYKVRPASNTLPHRFETGTLSHESMAGTLGAVEHLAWIGESMGATRPVPAHPTPDPARRGHILAAFDVIAEHETMLCGRMLDGLRSMKGVRVVGPDSVEGRVPTIAITVDGHDPAILAKELGDRGMFVWDGHYYAIEVVNRLGLMERGGMLRIGMGHYNTALEMDHFLNALEDITG